MIQMVSYRLGNRAGFDVSFNEEEKSPRQGSFAQLPSLLSSPGKSCSASGPLFTQYNLHDRAGASHGALANINKIFGQKGDMTYISSVYLGIGWHRVNVSSSISLKCATYLSLAP
jgi:hypothetical protein